MFKDYQRRSNIGKWLATSNYYKLLLLLLWFSDIMYFVNNCKTKSCITFTTEEV